MERTAGYHRNLSNPDDGIHPASRYADHIVLDLCPGVSTHDALVATATNGAAVVQAIGIGFLYNLTDLSSRCPAYGSTIVRTGVI